MAIRKTSDITFSSVNRKGVRPNGFAYPVGLGARGFLPLTVEYLVVGGGGSGAGSYFGSCNLGANDGNKQS